MAVFEHTISVILIRIKGDIQSLVYYVSETLSDVETRYMPLEKVELALVHNIKTLSQYFQAYTTIVVIKYPLWTLLIALDFSEWKAKYGTLLKELDIQY